ncbi:MAG: hypothetical protein R3C52_03050 [Hyphomonadaceae bacterium]
MGLLRFTDDGSSAQPAVRILEGLADLEARDGASQDTTLRERLETASRGRRAVLAYRTLRPLPGSRRPPPPADARRSVTDTTIEGLEIRCRARIEEARRRSPAIDGVPRKC